MDVLRSGAGNTCDNNVTVVAETELLQPPQRHMGYVERQTKCDVRRQRSEEARGVVGFVR